MQNQNTQPKQEGALSWDSLIEQESSFVLLEPGEYNFEVAKMERSQYQPSQNSKIRESSPMAELELKIVNESGQTATVFENLILHTATEWKISEFFISIGQKIKGQPFTPNWSQVIGSTGRAEVEINEYKNNQGQERKNNRVVRFLEPSAQPTQQPQATQPQTQAQPNTQPTQQQPAQPNTQPQGNPEFNF